MNALKAVIQSTKTPIQHQQQLLRQKSFMIMCPGRPSCRWLLRSSKGRSSKVFFKNWLKLGFFREKQKSWISPSGNSEKLWLFWKDSTFRRVKELRGSNNLKSFPVMTTCALLASIYWVETVLGAFQCRPYVVIICICSQYKNYYNSNFHCCVRQTDDLRILVHSESHFW